MEKPAECAASKSRKVLGIKNDFSRFSGSPVEIVEFMAVFYKLLLPVLTRVQRRPEIPDLQSLKGGAERAERFIHITRSLPNRAVINAFNTFHLIATGKRCPDRMSRLIEDKHTEPGEQEFQKPHPGILPFICRSALCHHHVPEVFLLVSKLFMHGPKDPLLFHQTDGLPCSRQVFGDLHLQLITVFGSDIPDPDPEIPFHPLEIFGRVMERYSGDGLAKLTAGFDPVQDGAFGADFSGFPISPGLIIREGFFEDHADISYLHSDCSWAKKLSVSLIDG